MLMKPIMEKDKFSFNNQHDSKKSHLHFLPIANQLIGRNFHFGLTLTAPYLPNIALSLQCKTTAAIVIDWFAASIDGH